MRLHWVHFGNGNKDDGQSEVYLSPPLLLLVATEH